MLDVLYGEKQKAELNIETVRADFEKMYKRAKINDMFRIRLKAWLYHSESRHKNNNPPFDLEIFVRRMGLKEYSYYVNYGLIDCEDVGGKELALRTIAKWYS